MKKNNGHPPPKPPRYCPPPLLYCPCCAFPCCNSAPPAVLDSMGGIHSQIGRGYYSGGGDGLDMYASTNAHVARRGGAGAEVIHRVAHVSQEGIEVRGDLLIPSTCRWVLPLPLTPDEAHC